MGTEASARLVSKFIILCLIFTLWQLGSEFKNRSIAQTLPDEEVRAFKQVAKKLGLNLGYPGVFLDGSFCNQSLFLGIGCNCTFQNDTICHIRKIELSASGLTGVIPDELANLTHLESLDLSMNQLTGSIPASLGNLSWLNDLDISNNQLIGSIPESLGNIKFQAHYSDKKVDMIRGYFNLDLSSNQLSGSIPVTLGKLAVPSAADSGSPLDLSLYGSFKQSIDWAYTRELREFDFWDHIYLSVRQLSQRLYTNIFGCIVSSLDTGFA